MKYLIIIFIFLHISIISFSQNYWIFPSLNENYWQEYTLKNKIKKIVKNTKSNIISYKEVIEFDITGKTTRMSLSSPNAKKQTLDFKYEKINNKLITKVIKQNGKNYDSTLHLMLNDTIFESKNYSSGKAKSYTKYISDNQGYLISITSVNPDPSPNNFFYDRSYKDSIAHITFNYLDSSTIFVFSRYNNNRNNYSKALIYLNHDKHIIKRDIEYYNLEEKKNHNYVEIYTYNKDNLLKKKYCISIDDFTKITQNSQAKIRYLYFENYEYNQKNLLSKVTLFNNLGLYQYKPFESVTTYTYEYW